ncbi:hypothetical protein AB6A40_011395, partial [Gnathostoma spinigerum]
RAPYNSTDRSRGHTLWLIRKPKQLPLNALKRIRFPKRPRSTVRVIKGSDESELSLSCQFEPAHSQLLHIPMINAKSQKDLMNLKANDEVAGTLLITNIHPMLDGLASPSSEQSGFRFDFREEASKTLPFEIHSIRRQPPAPSQEMKERLVVSGVKKRKGRKLPNLCMKNV